MHTTGGKKDSSISPHGNYTANTKERMERRKWGEERDQDGEHRKLNFTVVFNS